MIFVVFYYEYADSRNMAAFISDRETADWLSEQPKALRRDFTIEVWSGDRQHQSLSYDEFFERYEESNG